MVDATPPRRIVEGCSVKEMILARGGSTDRSGVARRKARPWGSCESAQGRQDVGRMELSSEGRTHKGDVGKDRGEKVVVGVRVVLLALSAQENLKQQVKRRNLILAFRSSRRLAFARRSL